MLDLGQLRHHLHALEKGDENSRQHAIHSLKGQREEDWASAPRDLMPALLESLQHQLHNGTKQPFLRKEIVSIFGTMGPRAEKAVPQLVAMLEDGNPDAIREAAASALGKIGKPARVAIDRLIEVSSSSRTNLAIQAVRALGDIGCADQRVRTALVGMWESPAPSQNFQVQLAFALSKLGIAARNLEKFLPAVLMTSQDANLRKAAAEALAWCGKEEIDVVPSLLAAALADKDENLRIIAEASLTNMKLPREKAIKVCARQLKESLYAEKALRNCGALAVPALIEAMASKETVAREKAARTLGVFGEAAVDAVPALTAALRDKDQDVRLAAAKGLWAISKNADLVVPTLVDLLKKKSAAPDEDAELRRRFLQTVIEALWRVGPSAQAAVPALVEKAKDKNRLISESAVSALRDIAPSAAEKALKR